MSTIFADDWLPFCDTAWTLRFLVDSFISNHSQAQGTSKSFWRLQMPLLPIPSTHRYPSAQVIAFVSCERDICAHGVYKVPSCTHPSVFRSHNYFCPSSLFVDPSSRMQRRSRRILWCTFCRAACSLLSKFFLQGMAACCMIKTKTFSAYGRLDFCLMYYI